MRHQATAGGPAGFEACSKVLWVRCGNMPLHSGNSNTAPSRRSPSFVGAGVSQLFIDFRIAVHEDCCPNIRFISRIGHWAINSQRFLVHLLVRGGDEAFEERMRLVRLAQELGMKLARNKEGMTRQFDDLHQLPIR